MYNEGLMKTACVMDCCNCYVYRGVMVQVRRSGLTITAILPPICLESGLVCLIKLHQDPNQSMLSKLSFKSRQSQTFENTQKHQQMTHWCMWVLVHDYVPRSCRLVCAWGWHDQNSEWGSLSGLITLIIHGQCWFLLLFWTHHLFKGHLFHICW